MGANVFGDAGGLCRFPASFPQHFGRDRLIGAPTVFRTRKQIRLGVHPAPVLAQRFQQFRTERHVAIPVPLAVPNMDDHAYAVDVRNSEMAEFGAAHAGRIQRHQHGAMEQIAS
jgi:hypothetical protein